MATAREIAIELFPRFRRNVKVGYTRTYGYYAHSIGRTAATGSMVVGPAMHMIGGLCVLLAVPVAPIYFVKREDGKRALVFEADDLEEEYILPHYDTLLVSARVYDYQDSDLDKLENVLNGDKLRDFKWGPHDLWHHVIFGKPKGETSTFFEKALARYKEIINRSPNEAMESDA